MQPWTITTQGVSVMEIGIGICKKWPIYCLANVDISNINRDDLVSRVKSAGGLDELAERVITREDFVLPRDRRVVSLAAFEVSWFGKNCFLDDGFLEAWSAQHLHDGCVCQTLAFEEVPFVAMTSLRGVQSAHVWCGHVPRRTIIDSEHSATLFRLAGYHCSKPRMLEAHPRRNYPSGPEKILLAVDRRAA